MATFPDENLTAGFLSSGTGILAMSNTGPHTNSSQWLITLRELPALEGKYVVFGRVIFGMGTLQLINNLPLKYSQRPEQPLVVVQSDRFVASMLDDHVNKWTRKRAPPKKSKKNHLLGGAGLPRVGSDSPRLATKNATLLVVGFDGAGKSTLVNNLLGRPFEATNPTVGFERNNITVPPSSSSTTSNGASAAAAAAASASAAIAASSSMISIPATTILDQQQQLHHQAPFNVQLYGLGGAENIRGYWANYLDAVHGLVFVVDSSPSATSAKGWTDLAATFAQLLSNPLVAHKPVLVFANKQDVPGALSVTEVSMRLRADEIIAANPGTQIQFVKCTARAAAGAPAASTSSKKHAAADESSDDVNVGTMRDVDPSIPRGLGWLLGRIEAVYQPLSERVAQDVAEARRKAKEQMEISRAKIKAAREEREAKEAAEEAAAAAKRAQ